MTGTIQVLTPGGEVLVEKPFVTRMAYMHMLADILETFRNHRIEINFESSL